MKLALEVVAGFREMFRQLARWIQIERAMFIGGTADGMVLPVPRDAKEWIIPSREGDQRYTRNRGISGTYFIGEENE